MRRAAALLALLVAILAAALYLRLVDEISQPVTTMQRETHRTVPEGFPTLGASTTTTGETP